MAEQYDDNNRGAAFTPFPTQRMILQGKINIEGTDSKIVIVQDETKDGRSVMEVYQKLGVLFDNDKKGNENAPDYSGPIGDGNLRMAAWRKMKGDKPYLSMNVSPKQGGGAAPSTAQQPTPSLPDDDIPW